MYPAATVATHVAASPAMMRLVRAWLLELIQCWSAAARGPRSPLVCRQQRSEEGRKDRGRSVDRRRGMAVSAADAPSPHPFLVETQRNAIHRRQCWTDTEKMLQCETQTDEAEAVVASCRHFVWHAAAAVAADNVADVDDGVYSTKVRRRWTISMTSLSSDDDVFTLFLTFPGIRRFGGMYNVASCVCGALLFSDAWLFRLGPSVVPFWWRLAVIGQAWQLCAAATTNQRYRRRQRRQIVAGHVATHLLDSEENESIKWHYANCRSIVALKCSKIFIRMHLSTSYIINNPHVIYNSDLQKSPMCTILLPLNFKIK